MVNTKSFAKRSVAVITALTLSVVAVLPLVTSSADAAQVTSRFIKMGRSQASATDVTYEVGFTTPTGSAQNVGGVAIQFCSNSPIVGIDCSASAPAGFDINEAGLAVASVVGLTGFTMHANTDANTFIYTNGTPQSIPASTAISFNLGAGGGTDGVTNPSGNGTFYARIITFDTQANAIAAGVYNDGAGVPTGALDYAGVALSVNLAITVTALIQETLNFVVTGTSVTMGTGTPQVINDTQQWISTAVNMDLDTNATSGVNIRLYGEYLKSGPTNSLTGSNTVGGIALSGASGSQFGICTKDSANTQVLADAQYKTAFTDCVTPASSTFGWDNANTTAVGGDTVYASTGPVDNDPNSNVDVYYAARADNNIPAGQYQAQHQLIATGTF